MNVMCRRGRPIWPDDERHEDRTEAAGGEDEAEVAGVAAQVVANEIRHQHRERPVHQEDGDEAPSPACPRATRSGGRIGGLP